VTPVEIKNVEKFQHLSFQQLVATFLWADLLMPNFSCTKPWLMGWSVLTPRPFLLICTKLLELLTIMIIAKTRRKYYHCFYYYYHYFELFIIFYHLLVRRLLRGWSCW